MNSPYEFLEAIPFLLVIAFFAIAIPWHSANGKRMDERNNAEHSKKLVDEATANNEATLHAEQAQAALPDTDAALISLLAKYGWREMLGTIYLSSNHLQLIREVGYGDPATRIELPNMKLNGWEERRVRKDVRESNKRNAEIDRDILDFGIDALAEEPTAEILKQLIDGHYIFTKEPFSEGQRTYTCTLTSNGAGLLELDDRYRRTGTANPYILRMPMNESRKIVAKILRTAISQASVSKAAVLERAT